MANLENRGVLIDTSVIIAHFRSREKKNTDFQKAIKTYKNCYISAITVYEMELGALRAKRSSDLKQILPLLGVLPFGKIEAEQAAKLDKELIEKNIRVGIRDVFIAGTALVHDVDVLTKNVEHFKRIKPVKLSMINVTSSHSSQ